MTATQTPVTPGVPALPSGLTTKSRRQRRWSLALAGVLLIVGSGIVFLLLFVNAGDRSPVLAVARQVPAGQAITGRDLKIVRVGADADVETISEARRSDIIGQTAAVDLLPGTLLVEDQLGEPVALEAGQAIVGLDLVAGEQAVPDLKEGDEVLLILTTPLTASAESSESSSGLGRVLTSGRVSTVTVSEDSEERAWVSVIVSEDDAEVVAGANAADRLSVVLVPAR